MYSRSKALKQKGSETQCGTTQGGTSATSKPSCKTHESHKQPVPQHAINPTGSQLYRQTRLRQPLLQANEAWATSPTGHQATGN